MANMHFHAVDLVNYGTTTRKVPIESFMNVEAVEKTVGTQT